MNFFDIILIAVILTCAGFAIFTVARQKKKTGGTGCSGCSGCKYAQECKKD